MDVIAVVDPLVSQVSPRHFRSFLLEPFRQLFTSLRRQQVFSSFFVCGDATKNIEVMCQSGPDCISIDENIDLLSASQITNRYDITLGGNIPLTTRMLLGSKQDNMAFVVDLLDGMHTHGEDGAPVYHNFILSPGCDMPYDTPPENVVGVLQAVRDPQTTRQMLANYQAHDFNLPVDLPDYAALARPLVEVFTLDSETCAACGYMLGAAQRAVDELARRGVAVDLVEYKFTQAENVARVVKMGIQKLPSLYLNGQLKHSSLIPSNRELVEEIEELI
jgi:uroporphyrinogen decarboxylase